MARNGGRNGEPGTRRIADPAEARAFLEAHPHIAFFEIISFLIRPMTLAMRLFGNMIGGHVVMYMFASFVIHTSAADQSPAVPEGAVVYEGDAAHVWVVQSDNSIAVRPIRAGRTSEGYVEVIDGLKSGERVVTRGSLFIDRAAAG